MAKVTRIIKSQEIVNRIAITKLYKALDEDFVPVRELEAMCKTMFNLGTSPLISLRKYFSKNELNIEIIHTLVKNSAQMLSTNKVRFNKRRPTMIVANYVSNGITRKVEVYYHPACEIKNKSKFAGLKFWK
jgi:hypothetical protein